MKPSKETRCAEGRGRPEVDSLERPWVRTQRRVAQKPPLERISEAVSKNKDTKFTALMHHVDVGMFERAFRRLRRNTAAGIDGETVESYEQELEMNLRGLWSRVQRGTYRPKPVLPVYIPKSDGGQRPLGIPALEDKIVQGAVAEVLNAIYEVDFLGFSYGFRPKRGAHQGLKALHTALMTRHVNYVLDADIRSFFDSVDHEWLLRMVAHRVADRRILRLIRGWLRAGVMEQGKRFEAKEGTPQGAGISPLLANIFLHYVLDLWIHQWRKRTARGHVIIVRYADGFVMGFQSSTDARKMLADLGKRFSTFGLTLHEGKTRLIEFGRISFERYSEGRGRRSATFSFLGFTHYCARSRKGQFIVKRRTDGKRMTRKLGELKIAMRRRMHAPVRAQHRWLVRVLRGHYAYYGLPSNWHRMAAFRDEIRRRWHQSLSRRSQRRMTWAQFNELQRVFPLPTPRITYPRDALTT